MENEQEEKNNTRKQLTFVASLKTKLLSKTNNDLNRQSRQASIIQERFLLVPCKFHHIFIPDFLV